MLPALTIIIPNWNGFPYLKDCLASIQSSKYDSKSEVIIVDNASSDGSVQWLADTYPDCIVIKNTVNMGFAAACNQGAQKASGDYILFLNTDMKIAPDFLEKMINMAVSNKDAASISAKIMDWDGAKIQFAGGMMNFYGHAFQIERAKDNNLLDDNKSNELLFSCGGAALFNRKIFLEAGGFDEDYFAYFEDVDLGLRLNLMGYKILYNPHAIAYHVGEASSKNLPALEKFKLYERNAFYTIIKNYSDATLAKILPAALFLAIARISSSLKDADYKQEKLLEYGNATIKALSEVIDNIHKLIEKRKIIQGKRKVDDETLLGKFGCFLKTNLYDAEYYTKLLKLTEKFEIDKLFAMDLEGNTFHAVMDDFKSLLEVTILKNEDLNKALAEKDLYIERVHDYFGGRENIPKHKDILSETREFLREKDRKIKKLLDDIKTKEEFLKLKDSQLHEKEREIDIVNRHIKTQEQAHDEFAKRQLDILTTLRNKLKSHP